jgi:uncharacterized protein (TIGR04255 family)
MPDPAMEAKTGTTTASTPFPDSPRVVYDKNPLFEVLCQLRFPHILRIETEIPAAFQEKIRKEFPFFRERVASPAIPELPPGMPDAFVKAIQAAAAGPGAPKAYEFLTADKVWTVTLTRGSLAIKTTKYTRWEEFKAYMTGPLQALTEIYAPAFFTRIGLRYQDLIQRSNLGLSGTAWPELLNPTIAGELASPELAGAVEEAFTQVLVRLPSESGQVRVRHGLVQVAGSDEECYLIDSDFYREGEVATDEAPRTLDSFNRQSGRLFRWCITDRLHRAMEPKPVLE